MAHLRTIKKDYAMLKRLIYISAVALSLTTNFSQATDYSGQLNTRQALFRGETLYSARSNNGTTQYGLTLQSTDGNLVIYRYPEMRAVWTAAIGGKGGTSAVIQEDGNFVVYTDSGSAVWSSGTGGHPTDAYRLHIGITGALETYVDGQSTIWRTPYDNSSAGCPTGQTIGLYPVCIYGMNQTTAACSSAEASTYAHSYGGYYGICH